MHARLARHCKLRNTIFRPHLALTIALDQARLARSRSAHGKDLDASINGRFADLLLLLGHADCQQCVLCYSDIPYRRLQLVQQCRGTASSVEVDGDTQGCLQENTANCSWCKSDQKREPKQLLHHEPSLPRTAAAKNSHGSQSHYSPTMCRKCIKVLKPAAGNVCRDNGFDLTNLKGCASATCGGQISMLRNLPSSTEVDSDDGMETVLFKRKSASHRRTYCRAVAAGRKLGGLTGRVIAQIRARSAATSSRSITIPSCSTKRTPANGTLWSACCAAAVKIPLPSPLTTLMPTTVRTMAAAQGLACRGSARRARTTTTPLHRLAKCVLPRKPQQAGQLALQLALAPVPARGQRRAVARPRATHPVRGHMVVPPCSLWTCRVRVPLSRTSRRRPWRLRATPCVPPPRARWLGTKRWGWRK